LEQKNKMADKIKMAAKHQFSLVQSFLCKSFETWDLDERNILEVIIFQNVKMAD
jgi:hypothetical protein